MIYYMVFNMWGKTEYPIPCISGGNIFITTEKKKADKFKEEMEDSFPECGYKVVPVEV